MKEVAWIDLFKKLNEEAEKTGESVVPLTDIAYYAEQILNIMDEPDLGKARQIATEMAEEV